MKDSDPWNVGNKWDELCSHASLLLWVAGCRAGSQDPCGAMPMPQGEKSIYSAQIKATKVYKTDNEEERQLGVSVAKPDAMLLNSMANVKFTLLPFE